MVKIKTKICCRNKTNKKPTAFVVEKKGKYKIAGKKEQEKEEHYDS